MSVSAKVTNGAIAGSVVTVITIVLGLFKVKVSGELAAALTTIISFGVGYITPHTHDDHKLSARKLSNDHSRRRGSATRRRKRKLGRRDADRR